MCVFGGGGQTALRVRKKRQAQEDCMFTPSKRTLRDNACNTGVFFRDVGLQSKRRG